MIFIKFIYNIKIKMYLQLNHSNKFAIILLNANERTDMAKEYISRKEQRIITIKKCILACEEAMIEKGYSQASIRDVSKLAGINQATFYNYFENFDHLRFFASMRMIKDYSHDLKIYLNKAETSLDYFLFIWDCFCDHAFEKPELYYFIFLADKKKSTESLIEHYYRLFPEELDLNMDQRISTMLIRTNLTDRAIISTDGLVKDALITKGQAVELNDMTLVIFEGMLYRALNNLIDYDNARNLTMSYICRATKSFLQKDVKHPFFDIYI